MSLDRSLSPILLALLAAVILAGAALAETKVELIFEPSKSVYCDICGKKITDGKYIVESGYTICEECSKLPRCAICGLPALKAHDVHGHVVCDRCFKTTEKCAYCGLPIVGPIYTFGDSAKFCEHCVKDRDIKHCYVCGRPLKEGEGHKVYNRDGSSYKLLCDRCYKTLPRCTACGKPIIGLVYTFEGHEGKYCFDCKTYGPFCKICGVPIERDSLGNPEDPDLCRKCRENILIRSTQVDSIFGQIVKVLNDSLDFLVWSPVSIEYVDHRVMAQIRKSVNWSRVFTEEGERASAGYFYRNGDDCRIFLLKGLSKAEIIHSLAHEYAHAWQAENCPEYQAPLISEGFAEWIAYKALGYLGEKDEQYRMRAKSDIYGRGLNFMMEIERERSPEAVLEYVKGSSEIDVETPERRR